MNNIREHLESFAERKGIFLEAMREFALAKHSRVANAQKHEKIVGEFDQIMHDFGEQSGYNEREVLEMKKVFEMHHAAFLQCLQQPRVHDEERMEAAIHSGAMMDHMVYACTAMASDDRAELSLVGFTTPLLQLTREHYEAKGSIPQALSVAYILEHTEIFTDFFQYLRHGALQAAASPNLEENILHFHDYITRGTKIEN